MTGYYRNLFCALVGGASLLLAACGGSDDESVELYETAPAVARQSLDVPLRTSRHVERVDLAGIDVAMTDAKISTAQSARSELQVSPAASLQCEVDWAGKVALVRPKVTWAHAPSTVRIIVTLAEVPPEYSQPHSTAFKLPPLWSPHDLYARVYLTPTQSGSGVVSTDLGIPPFSGGTTVHSCSATFEVLPDTGRGHPLTP